MIKSIEMENIFITWHYTTHGIAYLKHILSAFYKETVSFKNLNAENISQMEMNNVFGKFSNGFLFWSFTYAGSCTGIKGTICKYER